MLVYPFGEEHERMVVRFDPTSGRVQYFEAMRYKYADDPTKSLWSNEVWLGDAPWASWNVESIRLNMPVGAPHDTKG